MGTYTFHDAEAARHRAPDGQPASWPSRPTSGPSRWPRRSARTGCWPRSATSASASRPGWTSPASRRAWCRGPRPWTGDVHRLDPHRPGRRGHRPADPRRLQRGGQRRGASSPPGWSGRTVDPDGRRRGGHGRRPTHRVIDPATNAQLVQHAGGGGGDGDRDQRRHRRLHGGRQDGHGPDPRPQPSRATSPVPTWGRSPDSPRPRTRCCRPSWSSTIPRRSTVVRWPPRCSRRSWPTPSTTTASPPPPRPPPRPRTRRSVAPVAISVPTGATTEGP